MKFFRIAVFSAVIGGVLALSPSSAIELKMKYDAGQERTMTARVNFSGNISIDQDFRLEGKAEGKSGASISKKVISVDSEGIASIENKLDGFSVEVDSEAQIGEETHQHQIKLDETGGTYTTDGESQPIPSSDLEEATSKTWTVLMNEKGATVGMDLDSSQMSAEEAQQVQQLTGSLSGMMGQDSLLPEGDVEPGASWEEVLSVDELTAELSKENPMLPTPANLGIPDLVIKHTLSEVRQEAGNEMATINTTTQFDWPGGNIPLGIFNVTINRLAITGDSMADVNNTEGYLPRITNVTNMEFDLTVNLAFGEQGPQTYVAKGQIKMDSTITEE